MQKGSTLMVGLLLVIALVAIGIGMAARDSVERMRSGTNEVQSLINGDIRFEWSFQNVGEEEFGAPLTDVTLRVNGKAHEVGTYSGSCFEIAGSGWELQEGELSGVICWWAGGGSEIGVFREGNRLVVKEGELDEGTAETPGFRGNFETLLTL